MFKKISLSLIDLLGADFCEAACRTQEFFDTKKGAVARAAAAKKVDFLPADFSEKQKELCKKIGMQVTEPFSNQNDGAPTVAFGKATHKNMSPIGGWGCFRVGEDGRLYLASKSEHYHSSMGHNMPAFELLENARLLGIDNITHNNTRGYITRLCEREIIAALNDDCDSAIASKEPKVLNRIINLETGSLAVEAGIKMMLSRFYKLDKTYNTPKYAGKTPVFFVMADTSGGKEANYHGTTVIAQTFRGMWPEFYACAEKNELYKVVSVNINDIADFEEKLKKYNSNNYKTAGFLHEIVLMNYGGILLTKEYLQAAYRLCEKTDTPTLVDEIQSCMWYKGMFLFRLYGLKPDFAVIGKGFSGGNYPASKIITTYEMDNLNLFGALVTNGQEEMASLSYLITMKFAQENGDIIAEYGKQFEQMLCRLKEQYSQIIKVEGLGHLASIHFESVDAAVKVAEALNKKGVDISAQTYKANCPPAVLVKPPLIADESVIEALENELKEALQ